MVSRYLFPVHNVVGESPPQGCCGDLLSFGLIFRPWNEEMEVQGGQWPQQLGSLWAGGARIQTQLFLNEWVSTLAHVRTTMPGPTSHQLNPCLGWGQGVRNLQQILMHSQVLDCDPVCLGRPRR